MSTLSEQQLPPEMSLKMPENYDFNTRGSDWKTYKPYYLLRTDAVWEKSKLYGYFHSMYKAPLNYNNKKYYFIADAVAYNNMMAVEGGIIEDEIGSSGEYHKLFKGFSKNGALVSTYI